MVKLVTLVTSHYITSLFVHVYIDNIVCLKASSTHVACSEREISHYAKLNTSILLQIEVHY